MCTINKNLKEKRNYTNEFVSNKKKNKEKDIINLNKWYVGIFYRLLVHIDAVFLNYFHHLIKINH